MESLLASNEVDFLSCHLEHQNADSWSPRLSENMYVAIDQPV